MKTKQKHKKLIKQKHITKLLKLQLKIKLKIQKISEFKILINVIVYNVYKGS